MSGTPLPEWLEGQTERIVSRQRARADNAKLVVTFAVGVGASLLASALQTGTPSGWDRAATVFLTITFLLTSAVMLADRLEEPDHHAILQDGLTATPRWTDERIIYELRRAAAAAANINENVLTLIGRLMWAQLAGALLTSAAAVYSMLRT